MKAEEECIQVEWPLTPEEIEAAGGADPDAARVVRPVDRNPAATESSTAAPAGLDLSAYYWRGPEAGVRLGGLWGRWYVSLQDSGSRPGSAVRPSPLRLDLCDPPEGIEAVLKTTPIVATVRISGSASGEAWGATQNLLDSASLAYGRNPHFSIRCSGRFPADSASVVVGCTVPEIRFGTDGAYTVWDGERPKLWQAGVDEFRWIWGPSGFRPADLWRQVDWTLTPAAPTVSGSWSWWPWSYRFPESGSVTVLGGPSVEYHAYRADVDRLVKQYYQPFGSVPNSTGTDTTGTGNLGSIAERLRGFVLLSNDIRNRVNRDSNIIRGLHGIGQQPRYAVEFFTNSPAFPAFGTTPGRIYSGVTADGQVIFTAAKE